MAATSGPTAQAATIDEYIAPFPEDVKEKLQELRQTIRDVAPDAEEAIKYGIPTFVLHGNLVHFGGFKNHVGFYHGATNVEAAFQEQLARYKKSKGTIQFPLSEPLPLPLIRQMVEFRVRENVEKAQSKRKR
ncbi:MAG TPA: DUF1801 domain-containing protein [Tepidiformaceae bacterium]|nr:DUF1801 domain-containing protein [Tepidiformaceae bacterium]